MTCKQMGGPCDAPIQGETAEEMMDDGAQHITEMADQGDKEHQKIQAMMDKMKDDPKSGAAWNKKFEQDFADLPED